MAAFASPLELVGVFVAIFGVLAALIAAVVHVVRSCRSRPARSVVLALGWAAAVALALWPVGVTGWLPSCGPALPAALAHGGSSFTELCRVEALSHEFVALGFFVAAPLLALVVRA